MYLYMAILVKKLFEFFKLYKKTNHNLEYLKNNKTNHNLEYVRNNTKKLTYKIIQNRYIV